MAKDVRKITITPKKADTVVVAAATNDIQGERQTLTEAIPAANREVAKSDNNAPAFDADGYRSRLGEIYKPLVDSMAAIATRANDAPKTIETEEQAAQAAQIIRDARAAGKLAVDKRAVQEEVPKAIIATCLAFFKTNGSDRMERIVSGMTQRVTAYTRAVEEKKRLEAERIAEEARKKAAASAVKAEQAKTPETQAKHAGAAAVANAQAQQAAAQAAAPTRDVVRDTVSSFGGQGRRVLLVEIDDYGAIPLEAIRPFLDRDAILKAVKAFAKQTKGDEKLAGARIWWDTQAVVK